MEITILGSGSSQGVPQVACKCCVCASSNVKNKRKRASILIESTQTKILVDTSPELRLQCLENNISNVDAVIFTHAHSDHVAGIDDIRMLCTNKKSISAYMDDETFNTLLCSYNYIFNSKDNAYLPYLRRNKLEKKQVIGDIEVNAFDQIHGKIISQGLRFRDVVYSTDFSEIPEESIVYLQNLKVWVVDCLRYYYSPTHSHLEKTLSLIERHRPKLAILTHMSHDIDYDEISKILPKNVIAAFDNMKIELQ
jgi:phosphoribosyl 1,2-cyclic phosphate phosphodiesterase